MNNLTTSSKISPYRELTALILTLITVHYYLCMFLPDYKYANHQFTVLSLDKKYCILIVFAGIVCITELFNIERKPSAESYVWLLCFGLSALSTAFSLSSVWEEHTFLFTHIFCVYWIIARSGKLADGKSGKLLIIDTFNSYIKIPFLHYFDFISVLFSGLKNHLSDSTLKPGKNFWFTAVVLLICVALFAAAAVFLGNADVQFGKLLDKVFDFRWDFQISETAAARLLFSLIFVSPWLFGLMKGCAEEPEEKITEQKNRFESTLCRLRRIPGGFWTFIVLAFSVLYLAFFIMQFSYLFGAFAGKLPDGFIVSQYAREGFFELCKVITVNFSLLWLVTRISMVNAENNKLFKASCLALLFESIVFAIIAFSKLAMYIDIFGFTPLRLQSTWLVCVLLAACICWVVSIVYSKKTFRFWMFFGAASLMALCFV